MITISGKNFSFQATQIKNGTSITISSSGEIKFNTVALEAKMQSANKSDSYQSKSGVNFSHSKSDQSRSEPSARNPEVTRGNPFPGGGPPPRVVEPLPKAPEVIELMPAEEVILGDALDPPNGEFQVVDTKLKPEITKGNPFPGGGPPPRVVEPLPKAPEVIELMPAEEVILGDALEPPNGEFQVLGSRPKIEPTNNILRDFVRTPSLDNIQFIETDLSRELEAEAAGGFDQELISVTGLQPEVAGSVPMEKPQGIILGDLPEEAFDQELISATGLQPEVASPAPLEKPQGIVLGDALDPPNGEFQVLGSRPKIEPTNNILRDIVRTPSLDNIQFVETDLSRKLAAEEAGTFDDDLISITGLQPEVVSALPTREVIRNDALEPLNQSFDLKPAEEAKRNIFNFTVSNK